MKERPLFDGLCEDRLNETMAVCQMRGTEYGDTWRNGQWLISAGVRRRMAKVPDCREKDRAMACAALCDVKYQRWEGGFKLDHIDDAINYLAVLPGLMEL